MQKKTVNRQELQSNGARFFLGIGWVVAFGFSAYFTYDAIFLSITGKSATGRVEEMVPIRSGGPNSSREVTYFPKIVFTPQDAGQEFSFKGSVLGGKSEFMTGQTVNVLYDPENTERARISSFQQLWGPSVALGIFGAILFGLSQWISAWQKRQKQ